jgi:hypothetical protein
MSSPLRQKLIWRFGAVPPVLSAQLPRDGGVLPDGQPPPELPWTAYVGAVYAARQLASDVLDEQAKPDLVGLGADLELWLSDLFRER